MALLLRSLPAIFLAQSVLAATYSQVDDFVGSGFLDSFSFNNIPDPTNGRVTYVDAATAAADNLTFASDDSFIVRTDFTTVLDPSGPGRNSVRLISNEQYTNAVIVFNLRHMPQGCGTWPAVWTLGDDWPANGEVDILEGVNDQGTNQATLHTSPDCTMPATRTETGTALYNDCDTAVNGNSGCGVSFNQATSYGPTFNTNGGGWFATERTSSFVKVWFWAVDDSTVPSDVSSGSTDVDTDNWGTPTAYFPSDTCDFATHFGPHNIIINLTLCGDWAGAVYPATCPSTCVDYVNNNPADFIDAYFDFAWMKTYA